MVNPAVADIFLDRDGACAKGNPGCGDKRIGRFLSRIICLINRDSAHLAYRNRTGGGKQK
jgi:hypothetical protein